MTAKLLSVSLFSYAALCLCVCLFRLYSCEARQYVQVLTGVNVGMLLLPVCNPCTVFILKLLLPNLARPQSAGMSF